MTFRRLVPRILAALLLIALPILGIVGLSAVGTSKPDVRVCVEREAQVESGVPHLGSLTGSLWEPGRTLRVRFLEGGPRTRKLTLAAIKRWEKVANIKFVESSNPSAEIRIAFKPGEGSWSYIGRGALQIPLNQRTMNLGWLHENSPESEFYVAIHEAGHALGFVHGQNLPNAAIPWDEPKVYAYFAGAPNYWPRATTFANVLAKYGSSEVNAGPFDRDSIMQYPVDKSLTTNGFSIGWNTAISAGDAAFARRAYPFPGDHDVIKCPDPRTFLIDQTPQDNP